MTFRPLDATLREQLVNAVLDGESQYVVARRFRVSQASVSRAVSAHNRPDEPEKRWRNNKANLTLDDARTIRRLHRNGLSLNKLRMQYAVGQECIRAIVFNRMLPETDASVTANVTAEANAIATYRTEKAMAEERRQRAILADAKREYDALLKREREKTKGGRPKKAGAFQIPVSSWSRARRSDFVGCKPEDALLTALGEYYGRSA